MGKKISCEHLSKALSIVFLNNGRWGRRYVSISRGGLEPPLSGGACFQPCSWGTADFPAHDIPLCFCSEIEMIFKLCYWLSEIALLSQTSTAHFSLSLFSFNWSSPYFPLSFMPSLLLSYMTWFFFPLLYHYVLPCWLLIYGKNPNKFKRKKKNQTKSDLGNQHERANSIQHSSTASVPEDL